VVPGIFVWGAMAQGALGTEHPQGGPEAKRQEGALEEEAVCRH